MRRNFVMDGTLQKIEWLFVGIDKIVDPNFWAVWVNAKAYGRGNNPQVTLSCPPDNQYPVFIQDHIDSSPNERTWLHWGGSNVMDWSYFVQAMNIFYVIGTPGDILFVEAR